MKKRKLLSAVLCTVLVLFSAVTALADSATSDNAEPKELNLYVRDINHSQIQSITVNGQKVETNGPPLNRFPVLAGAEVTVTVSAFTQSSINSMVLTTIDGYTTFSTGCLGRLVEILSFEGDGASGTCSTSFTMPDYSCELHMERIATGEGARNSKIVIEPDARIEDFKITVSGEPIAVADDGAYEIPAGAWVMITAKGTPGNLPLFIDFNETHTSAGPHVEVFGGLNMDTGEVSFGFPATNRIGSFKFTDVDPAATGDPSLTLTHFTEKYDHEGVEIMRVEGFKPGTTVGDMKAAMPTSFGETYTVRKYGELLDDSELLWTGATLITWAPEDGSGYGQYDVIIEGDVTGTGKMNISQIVALAKEFSSPGTLNENELLAGNINHNGKIDISDLSMLAKML